ncbi:MAG: sigma-54-dependent Fis family transcriptional regulator [Deltaproteobacteria bacterium]|nr:sigma-54-dependent Fis family transcriptional regulator [Deltaproteobacteria bacterium]MCW5807310.1 sigma-54-dependent Fis family transcriptional regulator [Deltaproteobacteria bacterium]
MGRILVIDDEAGVRFGVRSFLQTHGFEVKEAASQRAAEEEFRQSPPDLALLDYSLPDGDGLELIGALKKIDERVPIVMITGHASIDLAVHAVKHGADHFIEKPLKLPALLVIVQRILESYRNRRKQVAVSVYVNRHQLDPFIGESAAMRVLTDEAHHVLDSHAPVLIQGETGTGKGVLAGWLHRHGPRAEEAFVDINCAGLSRELMESELFGHERGAFTGATSAKLGLLDVAHRGTAFLDEIGEIDPQLQPRLLKALEEKRFRRVGDVRDHSVDVRLIAATNRDLGRLAREGKFRSDLYFRINTIALTIPPLRKRPEDIPLLARRIAAGLRQGDVELTPRALRTLQGYAWPGNIRELRNVIERALLHARGAPVLDHADLRFGGESSEPSPASDEDLDLTLEELERKHVERVLRHENNSVEAAAARLGISRSALYQRLKRYRTQLPPPPELSS